MIQTEAVLILCHCFALLAVFKLRLLLLLVLV